MKIRHKQSGVELEGEFEEQFIEYRLGIPSVSCFVCGRYGSRYDRREWDAVPAWVDVTGECGLAQLPESCIIVHNFREIDVRSGYRLRNVQVSIDGFPKWAFIVERKA